MAIYAGIDPSISCTGIAVIELTDEGKFVLLDKKSIKPTPRSKEFERKLSSFEVFKWATQNLQSFKDLSFFVFENYSYGSPGHLADLGEMTGLFKYHIANDMNLPFDTIAPSSVKKIITGSGRATKEEVRANLANHLENFHDIEWSNFDESDATAIAIAYGIKMHQVAEEMAADESEKN